MNMKYFVVLFLLISTNFVFAQDIEDKNDIHIFRIYDTDRLYVGWQDPRAFISRLYFNKNIDLEPTLRKLYDSDSWDFDNIVLSADTKIASEIIFYRNKYLTVGVAGAMEILMFATKDAKFHVYDFNGQFSPYLDLWLDGFVTGLDLKIRIYPFYHQSTHFVDGYRGELLKGASYEFGSVILYYYIKGFTVYGGVEGTYHLIGNGVPLFKGHVGLDYRYPLYSKYDINLIAGMNIAAIYDKKDQYGFIDENWSPALNIAVGVEFHRYVVSIKYSYQRGRGISTYFKNQSFIGSEISIFL